VLAHGAWHDAGVWDSLRAALGREGARSFAVQLPSDDVAIDASGYARDRARRPEARARRTRRRRTHSMSGIALPLVPALAPVRRLIFLAALVPVPGQRMIEVQTSEDVLGDTGAVARDQLGRSYWTSTEAAIDILYPDCDAGLARKIAGRLRPQARTPHEEPCPITEFPDVPTSYLLMREDRMIRPEWSRMAARARLGVEPIELTGGHSPMLARPEQLARRLIELDGPASAPRAA
jgi:Alpha/beta hydrolase family